VCVRLPSNDNKLGK